MSDSLLRIEIKRICVPTDFSECSDHAVKYGAALARQYDATLHLLHVLDNADEKLRHPDFTSDNITVTKFLKALEQGATTYLAGLIANKEWSDLTVERVHVTGQPADAIVRYAQQNNIDLLVVGTLGRSGLSHVLIGSVAERVIRTSPCPVLAIRYPTQRNFIVPEGMSKLPGVE